MRRVIYITILAVWTVAAGGCNYYWYQEDNTYYQAQRDRQSCDVEMQKYASYHNRWSDFPLRFEEDCMREKGYRLVEDRSLPLRTKRANPLLSERQWRGVAGKLESGNCDPCRNIIRR